MTPVVAWTSARVFSTCTVSRRWAAHVALPGQTTPGPAHRQPAAHIGAESRGVEPETPKKSGIQTFFLLRVTVLISFTWCGWDLGDPRPSQPSALPRTLSRAHKMTVPTVIAGQVKHFKNNRRTTCPAITVATVILSPNLSKISCAHPWSPEVCALPPSPW